MHKPSVLETYIASLPEDLQRLALQAVKEEHDRLARGDYTPQEQEMFDLAKEMGAQCRRTVDQIAFEVIAGGAACGR